MKKLILGLFSLSLLFASCEHHHLYYVVSNTATIKFNVDWSYADLTPNGVTVLAYNSGDGSLYEIFSPQNATESFYLSFGEGTYDLVFFNNTPDEFSAVDFSGYSDINTLLVSAKDKTSTREVSEEDSYLDVIMDPDVLASTVLRNVEVTSEMIDIYYDRPDLSVTMSEFEYTVYPERVVYDCLVEVHVKGLKYALSAPYTFLKHLAGGYNLGSELVQERGVMHEFVLNNRVFDEGSTANGTITKELTTFGKAANEDTRYIIDIAFILLNGETYPLVADVTDQVNEQEIKSVADKYYIYLELELPEAIGDAEDGAFDPNVDSWVDEFIDMAI
ncbi:MAG: DUF5119 domain-containing protein [Rikenellaceae bacterium]